MADKSDEPVATRERVAKAAGWSALQSWGARVISLAVFVLLARLLEPKHFGLVAMALVFINLIQTIVENSFGEALVQRQELSDEQIDTAFWINLFVGLLLALAMIVLAEIIADQLKEPQLEPILRVLSVCCVLSGLSSVPQALLQRSLGYKPLAIRAMVATLVSGVVAVVAAAFGLGVWSLVIQTLVFSGMNMMLVWVASSWRPRFRFSSSSALQLASFTLHSLGARVGDFLSTRLIDMLIGVYLGTVALGYYSIGYKLVMILNQMLTQVTTQVSLSTFSRLQSDPERMRRAFYEAVQLTCFFAIPAFVGLSLLADDLVVILFGELWKPAIPVLKILAYLGVVFALSNLFSTVAAASGRPDLRLLLIVLRVVTCLVLFFAVVDHGISAVAIAYVLSALVAMPFGFLITKRLIGIELGAYVRSCFPLLLGGLAMIVCSVFLGRSAVLMTLPTPLHLVVTAALIFTIYLLIVVLVERSLLKRVFSLGQLVLRRKR